MRFLVYVLVLTAGYLVYYLAVILMDVYRKEPMKADAAESFDTGGVGGEEDTEPDDSVVIEEDGNGGFRQVVSSEDESDRLYIDMENVSEEVSSSEGADPEDQPGGVNQGRYLGDDAAADGGGGGGQERPAAASAGSSGSPARDFEELQRNMVVVPRIYQEAYDSRDFARIMSQPAIDNRSRILKVIVKSAR